MIPPLMVWVDGMLICLVDEIKKESNTNHSGNCLFSIALKAISNSTRILNGIRLYKKSCFKRDGRYM